jgi:hypothetical protein
MAKSNNQSSNRFSGMFDSGEGFVPVDWSKITGDIVKEIQTVDEERQKQRGEIQTKTDNLLTDLRDYQAGGNNTFNGYVLDGSTQVKDYMLMQNKLLKQGKLDPNSYTRSQQLLQDDWNSFQTAADTFNTDYAAAIEAVNAGDSSKLALLSFDGMQKATDIQNSRLVINTDGRLYSQTEDGTLVGFTNMNARQKDLPKNYNITEGAKGFAATLGQYQKAYPSMTIQDIASQPDFVKARDTFIDGVLNQGTGRDFLSILTQNGFELTQNPEEVNENTILVKHDGNGMLQPDSESLNKHSDRAKEIMRKAISVQLDYKETAGGTVTASEKLYKEKKRDEIKGGGDVYALVADLQSADANAVESAATQLQNQFAGITRIQHLRDNIGRNIGMQIYTNASSKPVPVQFKDPKGNVKTKSQITAELFPIFNGGELTTQQISDIESGYLSGLTEEERATFKSRYNTPILDISATDLDKKSFGLDKSKPTVIDQTNIINKENKDAATAHTKALKNILDDESLFETDKKKQIKDLNKQYQQQLGNSLSFTNKAGETESLRLEQDDEGNLVIKVDGKTFTIVNTVTGDVDLATLQRIMNSKQAPAGSLTTRGEGRFTNFNN